MFGFWGWQNEAERPKLRKKLRW